MNNGKDTLTMKHEEERRQLSVAISRIATELTAIEKVLGVKEAENDESCYQDVPRRLDQLIRHLLYLATRLGDVKDVMLNLRRSVG